VAREKTRPLTPDEAKTKLLEAASRVGPLDFTRRHPWEGVSAAFLLGCLAGSESDARGVARESLRLLLKAL
jgi:hypothetical protein